MSHSIGGANEGDNGLSVESDTPPKQDVCSKGPPVEVHVQAPVAGDAGSMSASAAPRGRAAPDGAVVSSGAHVRWWLSFAGGLVVTIPLAWLLSYGAALPFYLGLFFFALFGLMIGAVIYRLAAPGRPYGRGGLIIGTAMIVLVGWGLSVVKESRDFPVDIAKDASASRKLRLGDRTIEEYRAEVGQQVRDFLRERHPPGGTIGYIRWITTSGELSSVDIESLPEATKRNQRKHWWVMRVVLSVLLLAFGVGSQTLLLRLPGDSKAHLQAAES